LIASAGPLLHSLGDIDLATLVNQIKPKPILDEVGKLELIGNATPVGLSMPNSLASWWLLETYY
jgi:hypothetical protein